MFHGNGERVAPVKVLVLLVVDVAQDAGAVGVLCADAALLGLASRNARGVQSHLELLLLYGRSVGAFDFQQLPNNCWPLSYTTELKTL